MRITHNTSPELVRPRTHQARRRAKRRTIRGVMKTVTAMRIGSVNFARIQATAKLPAFGLILSR